MKFWYFDLLSLQTLAAEAEGANKNAIKFTFFKFTIYVPIGFFIFSSLAFTENQVLNKECNPSKKLLWWRKNWVILI